MLQPNLKKNRDIPVNEFSITIPYMNYGKSKRRAEDIVNKAFIEDKIDTTIIRPSWFYGPGLSKRQIRLYKMIKNKKAIIFGDGNNLRSMTYIHNLCEALLLVTKNDVAIGETYYIADDKVYTLKEIYKTIADALNTELDTLKFPKIFSDVAYLADYILQKFGINQGEIHVVGEMSRNISCSVKKAKKELNYKPQTSLEDGMKKTINWCKERDIL